MKDESSLESAGPVAIVGFLVLVLVIASWIMVGYQGDWGHRHAAPGEAPQVAEASH